MTDARARLAYLVLTASVFPQAADLVRDEVETLAAILDCRKEVKRTLYAGYRKGLTGRKPVDPSLLPVQKSRVQS